ncbi:MAG TPA: hypothetical protein VKY90_10930 [Candidatus Dormibacteraeota bacterium]|nr:hypothetical protein [Candidatus Dormibacteraeota bacterium]
MRYDEIVSRAWAIVWRHPYLWLLGLLGGGEAGVSPLGFGLPGPNLQLGQPGRGLLGTLPLAAMPFQVTTWLSTHVVLLIGLAALLLLYLLAYFVLSCIVTPALIRAAAEHDAGRAFNLRLAWQVGLGTFPRVLGLRLLIVLVDLLVLIALALLVGLTIVLFAAHQPAAGVLVLALLLGVLLLLVPAGIAWQLVTRLALRAIVLEQRGTLSALGRGFQLLSHRLGRVLLVWLLGLALGIVAGLAAGVALLALTAILVAISIGSLAGLGVQAGLTSAVVLLFVLAVATPPLGGAVGTYFSTYWTLAFRRLELEPAVPYPIVPGSPPPSPGVQPPVGT